MLSYITPVLWHGALWRGQTVVYNISAVLIWVQSDADCIYAEEISTFEGVFFFFFINASSHWHP